MFARLRQQYIYAKSVIQIGCEVGNQSKGIAVDWIVTEGAGMKVEEMAVEHIEEEVLYLLLDND